MNAFTLVAGYRPASNQRSARSLPRGTGGRKIFENGTETIMEFQGNLQDKTTTLTMTGPHAGTVTAIYEDSNWGSNTISGGDKLHLSGLSPDTVYTVKVFHVPTESIVQMSGDSSSIQTQP